MLFFPLRFPLLPSLWFLALVGALPERNGTERNGTERNGTERKGCEESLKECKVKTKERRRGSVDEPLRGLPARSFCPLVFTF
jgi:hypothetical protein